MIFPQLSPQYYGEKDRDILQRMEKFYSESVTLNQSFWVEADIDTRFWASEVTLWSDLYPNLPANRRRLFNFNRLRRVVNLISGHQRRTRKSMIAVPFENSDQQTADQFTRILSHLSQKEQILETISDVFEGALITGMNLLHVWLDYRDDPVSGTIRVDKCDYNSFLIDPYFKKTDLSDCNGIWKRSYLTKRECISLLPNHSEELSDLSANYGRDGKFQFAPESYGWAYKDLMSYDEFYYRDYRLAKMLIDSQTGETMEWKSDDEQKLKEFVRSYPQITVIEQEIPTVKVAIVVQGKVFYDGPNPMGIDTYPMVPVFAYYNPQIPYYYLRVQGIIRDLRDAQYLYARRKVIELDILESQVNSGWIYKPESLVNPHDVFLSGQGKGVAIKQGTNIGQDIQQIQPPQIPPSMFQLSESLSKEIMEISGVNEELLGSATDDKAGILSMLRQGAGLTTLQGLFDGLDQSQKLLGRLLINVIQNNFTPGKVQRILNEDPAPQFYNKNFGTYDCVVEDGLNTATQKQMQFAQLIQLRELGVPIPDTLLIESVTLQNKNQLVQALEQQQQQQQQQQEAQLQAALQEQQARTNLANARATADQGLGIERVSRVQENRALAVERRAEAEKDHVAALLDFIKAIKELEGIDIANLEKLLALARISSQEQQRAEEVQQPQQGLQALQGLG